MKRLVLLGEGHGEVSALPVLMAKLLRERSAEAPFFVDREVLRTRSPAGLIKWDKVKGAPDDAGWIAKITYASRQRNLGGILAIYDGDAKNFPAGSPSPFCAATAAKAMAAAAKRVGAGTVFSLAVVFACVEYETWLVAGAESLAGKSLPDGRLALPRNTQFPGGDPASHGKRWVEEHCPNYRPTRDQRALTELLDLNVVREKKLRSFARLEHALDELLTAAVAGRHIATPD